MSLPVLGWSELMFLLLCSEMVMECTDEARLLEFQAEATAKASSIAGEVSLAFAKNDVETAAAGTVALQYHHKLLEEVRAKLLRMQL